MVERSGPKSRLISAVFVMVMGGMLLSGCTGEGALPDGSASAAPAGGDPNLQLVSDLPSPSKSSDASGSLVTIGDVLDVNIYGMDRLSRSVQVDLAGNISLPLVNAVRAANRTVPELEQAITAAYGRYLQSPSVTLLLKDSPSRRAIVDGQVMRPGTYPVNERTTLSQVIAEAGGLNNIADQSKIFVYRNVGGRQYVANYSIADIRANVRPAPRIYGRDTVVVFSSSSRVAWENLKEALGLAQRVAGVAVSVAR